MTIEKSSIKSLCPIVAHLCFPEVVLKQTPKQATSSPLASKNFSFPYQLNEFLLRITYTDIATIN